MRRSYFRITIPSFLVFFTFATSGAAHAADPAGIAAEILDDSKPAEHRQKLAADPAIDASKVIEAMVVGLDSQADLKEEYRRIPWIRSVAFAVGKRNRDQELKQVLLAGLPEKGASLRHWQAVVIGGGLINGISLSGGWPSERLDRVVANAPSLRDRWERVLDRARVMADDETIVNGIRYDSLRILGVGTWDRRGAQIFRYLLRGVDEELQSGAISALNDIRSPSVGQALLSGLSFYTANNRDMALDAMTREDSRIFELVMAVEEGRLTAPQVGDARIAKLKKVEDPALRARVEKTLGTE